MILQTFRKINVRSFQIMKDLHTPKRVSMGRWNIEKCEKKMFTKMDYANEDHCGTCVVANSTDKNEQKYNEDEYLKYYLL
jgi:hypothetical protein